VSHFDICFKEKKYIFIFFELYLAFVSTLPSTHTIKVIDLIFLNELTLENWAMNMHFNPIPILQGLFLGGRGAFIGLN